MLNDDMRTFLNAQEAIRTQLEIASKAITASLDQKIGQSILKAQEATFPSLELLSQTSHDIVNVMERHKLPMVALQRSFEAMSTSWIDKENSLRSINGFVALQGIGHGLNTIEPFNTRLADALRTELGDWRKKVSWPKDIFLNPVSRTSFYREQGLNPTLTAFPSDAFEEITGNTGLKGTQIPVAEKYGFDSEREAAEKDVALERNSAAYGKIYRLETQLRRFIDERMEQAFGTDWGQALRSRRDEEAMG